MVLLAAGGAEALCLEELDDPRVGPAVLVVDGLDLGVIGVDAVSVKVSAVSGFQRVSFDKTWTLGSSFAMQSLKARARSWPLEETC